MHTQFVADCVFPHTDNLLITGSGDGTTALWDIETASMIQVSYLDVTPLRYRLNNILKIVYQKIIT